MRDLRREVSTLLEILQDCAGRRWRAIAERHVSTLLEILPIASVASVVAVPADSLFQPFLRFYQEAVDALTPNRNWIGFNPS